VFVFHIGASENEWMFAHCSRPKFPAKVRAFGNARRLLSGIRDAPISWYDLRRRKISGSDSRFNSRLESGELLLVSRHQLRVKMNDRLVTSMVPGEAFDKRHETFAASLRPGVNAEAVSESDVAAPP
jgi:hypothetical protein